jgi:hypothetical protein
LPAYLPPPAPELIQSLQITRRPKSFGLKFAFSR